MKMRIASGWRRDTETSERRDWPESYGQDVCRFRSSNLGPRSYRNWLRFPLRQACVGWWLLGCWGWWSLLAAGTWADDAGPQRPPNILLLFSDDQRDDTIAAWGNPHIKTPHLDALAKSGTNFRANYCFGSNSGAVCIPSRAMLHTGRTWLNVKNDMSDAVTLGGLLGDHGYRTFATGKWHNGEPAFLRSFQSGRAIFFGGMSDHTQVPVQDLSEGRLQNDRIGEKFSSELFADAAVEFLLGQPNDQPFFCYVAFSAPHDPRQPPLEYRQHYYDNRPPLPANFLPQLPFNNGFMDGIRDENLAAWPRTPEVISDQLAEYYGMITHMDQQIGRILQALEKSGQADNTYVVFASDHGLAMGSHGLLGKQNLYEHSMRCPLIVVGPDVPADTHQQAFTYLHDLFPTLCDIAGVDPPDHLDGHNLRWLWTGKQTHLRETLFLPFLGLMRSIRDQRWKLIQYPPLNYTELFDLENDPDEQHNLADDPQHHETLARMFELLAEAQQQAGDRQALTSVDPQPWQIDLSGKDRQPDRWQPRWIVEKYFRQPGP